MRTTGSRTTVDVVAAQIGLVDPELDLEALRTKDPDFFPLHDDQRFETIVEELKRRIGAE